MLSDNILVYADTPVSYTHLHANNDMAGEDADSWLSQFKASGSFDSVDTQIAGLGEIPAVQDLYVAHTAAVIGK